MEKVGDRNNQAYLRSELESKVLGKSVAKLIHKQGVQLKLTHRGIRQVHFMLILMKIEECWSRKR